MKATGTAAAQIERTVPSQPLGLAVRAPTNMYRRQLALGIAYALRTTGDEPEIGSGWAVQVGPLYERADQRMPLVTVSVSATGQPTVHIVKRPSVKQLNKFIRSQG
jgi:hypothetical protein